MASWVVLLLALPTSLASNACVNLACAPKNIEADIVFVVDVSNGNADNFDYVRSFLSNFTSALTISPTMAQVGIYTYALNPKSLGTLKALSTPDALAQAIAGIQYAGDDVTDKQLVAALQLEESEVTATNGFRSNVTHVLVVLSTDQWTGPDPLQSAVLTQVRSKYDFILGVGMGPSAIENNFEGLRNLVGGNPSDVMYAYTYDQLQFVQPWIWGSHVPTTVPPTTAMPTQDPSVPCALSSVNADVFLIVDTSTAISAADYDSSLLDFVGVFGIGDGLTQFALVTASVDSELYYTGFHNGQTRSQILSILSSLTQDANAQGQTLKLALQAIQGAYLSQNYNTPLKTVVYFSGTTDFDSDPNTVATTLASQYGVKFLAVRYETTADSAKLGSFTGSTDCVYEATTAAARSGIAKFLQTNICNKKGCR